MKAKLLFVGVVFISIVANSAYGTVPASNKSHEKQEEIIIPATEDLMREHGVLRRILLIGDFFVRRIARLEKIDVPLLRKTVLLMQSFINNYHEKMEEDYIFPLFEQKKVETSLVKTLRIQHEKGRAMVQRLLIVTDPKKPLSKMQTGAQYHEIKHLLKKLLIMYRPHMAREDTVLFPKVRSLISHEEFDALSDRLEDTEEKLFGEEGFEKIVKQITSIERTLGIFELNQFTPVK